MRRCDILRQVICLNLLVTLLAVCGRQPATAALPPPDASPAGAPVRLTIPAIGVDAAVESVGLTAEGLMDVPQNFNDVAWYQPGPRPGEPGNAVIDGHVDSAVQGAAVFWNLRLLVPGDTILVMRDDGSTTRFIVTGTERYDDATAPLTRIYGPTDGAHLNLVTCDAASSFDRQIKSYQGSIVVSTDAIAPAP